MQRSKKISGRVSRFECLENRNLLAGNVTTNFVPGLLTLTGDAAANNIQVSQLSNGDWQVKGIGTKIDGGNSAPTFTGVTDITIDLGAGNDVLKVQNGTLTGTLFVDYTAGVQGSKTTQFANLHVGTFDVEQASTGTNVVTMNNIMLTTTMGGTVTTGSGKDVVSLNNIYAFGITVNTAGGNDAVTITNSFGQGGIAVNAGDGSDVVTVNNCRSEADVSIDTGDDASDGNDTVDFSGLTTDSLDISDQNGSDTIVGSHSSADEGFAMNISDATKGNDAIVLTGLHAGSGGILTSVGRGNNTIAISNCTALGEIDEVAAGSSASQYNTLAITNCTTQDEVEIDGEGHAAIVVNNVTATTEAEISAGTASSVISINKLNVLGGQSTITTGDANDVIAIANSKFNSAGSPETNAPFPIALTIQTGGGNDSVSMVNDSVINGLNINTGDGTDAVAITKVNATALDVGVDGGKHDTVVVSLSTALLAEFHGNNGDGDTLVYKHLQNHFDTETDDGFDHVS